MWPGTAPAELPKRQMRPARTRPDIRSSGGEQPRRLHCTSVGSGSHNSSCTSNSRLPSRTSKILSCCNASSDELARAPISHECRPVSAISFPTYPKHNSNSRWQHRAVTPYINPPPGHLVPDDGGIKGELALSRKQTHILKDVAQLLPVRQGACGGVTLIPTPCEVYADGLPFLQRPHPFFAGSQSLW